MRENDYERLMNEALIVSNAMQKYGGGFMEAIGIALTRADIHNIIRIKRAWPDEWNKYLKMEVLSHETTQK